LKINIKKYNHPAKPAKTKKYIGNNIISIQANTSNRDTIKNSLYNSYHRIVCNVKGNSYNFYKNNFVKEYYNKKKNITQITVNSFPAFYWSMPNTLNMCYQHITKSANDFITVINKDILYVKEEYKNSITALSASANVLVKSIELFQDVVLPTQFYKKIVKASQYFHSTKYFTYSKSNDYNNNVNSPTFYWENDTAKIRIYNRSAYMYKNQTVIKDYVIIRFELIIKRFQTVLSKINKSYKPNNTNILTVFDRKIKNILFEYFKQQLNNIFPLPRNKNNIINIKSNLFYDCDKKWTGDYKFKQNEVKKCFINDLNLKNKMSDEISAYMRTNIDETIIDFVTKNVLKYPIVISQIMYLFFEWNRHNMQGHISDNTISQIVKINRRKYFPVMTRDIIVNTLSERYANTNKKVLKKQLTISKNKLMELIKGKPLNSIL